MSHYRRLKGLADEHEGTLSTRQRAAFASACAHAALDAVGPHLPIAARVVEAALEVGWAVALGEAISPDEIRARLHRLEEDEGDAYAEMTGVEQAALRALWAALATPLPRRGRTAVRIAAGALFDVVDCLCVGDDEAAARVVRWCEDTLVRLGTTPDAALRREGWLAAHPIADAWLARPWGGVPHGDDAEPQPETVEHVRADLRRHDRARRARVATWRGEQTFGPWREPTGLPLDLEVRRVGRGPGSSEGKIATSGHDHFGLFDVASDAHVFTAPSAVAYGMAPALDALFAWRVERRADGSGIGRGDYDWTVERYRWPEAELVSSHTVSTRKIIEWCWPLRLDVPAWGEGRVFVLKARSEDWVERLHLVERTDGSVLETTDADEAHAARLGKGATPGKVDEE